MHALVTSSDALVTSSKDTTSSVQVQVPGSGVSRRTVAGFFHPASPVAGTAVSRSSLEPCLPCAEVPLRTVTGTVTTGRVVEKAVRCRARCHATKLDVKTVKTIQVAYVIYIESNI